MNNSFCVGFEDLEEAAIKKLIRRHPEALPISVEWKVEGDKGSCVVWWVPSPEVKSNAK